MKTPAFQFYPADWLSDENVQLMTMEQEGIYIRLLAICWIQGSIPNNIEALSKLTKGSPKDDLTLVQRLFTNSKKDASRLVHKRLEEERTKQNKWKQKCADAGKYSGKSRRAKSLKNELTLKNSSTKRENSNELNGNSIFIPISIDDITIRNIISEVPNGLKTEAFSEAWKLWINHLKQKKVKTTELAFSMQLKKCLLWGETEAIKIIHNAIEHNWQSLYEIKENGNPSDTSTRKNALKSQSYIEGITPKVFAS